MRNRLLITLALCAFFVNFSYAQVQDGFIKGKVTDKITGEELGLAFVIVSQNDVQKSVNKTDYEGNYVVGPLSPGRYDLVVKFIGYNESRVNGIIVKPEGYTEVNVQMSDTVVKVVEIIEFRKPLFDKDETTNEQSFTREDIEKIPFRGVGQIASATAGTYSENGGTPNIRGGRTSGTVYFVDGMKVSSGNLNLPNAAMEQVSVITGGIPAEYGDLTGGVISVTTRGPSSQFFGGIEAVSSQFLDPFGYNVFEANLSGPIWKKKNTTDTLLPRRSVLGFFVSGNFTHQNVNNPGAIPNHVVTDEVLEDLKNEPLIRNPNGQSFIPKAELLTADDMMTTYVKPNTQQLAYSLNGKIDFQPVENVNLTLGGNYGFEDRDNYVYTYSLWNAENNPQTLNRNYRGFARLRQNFKTAEGSPIKNAYYTLQVGYQRNRDIVQDRELQDDYFKYGYTGRFDRYRSPFYVHMSDTVNGRLVEGEWLVGYFDTAINYTPGGVNPILDNYNLGFYRGMEDLGFNVTSFEEVATGGGILNGWSPLNVYSLWAPVGVNYSAYQKTDNEQFNMLANGAVTINNHALKFGMQYEQQIFRSFSVGGSNNQSVQGLWILAQQLTNTHLMQGDPYVRVDEKGLYTDTVDWDWVPDYAQQTTFDRNLRNHLISKGATDEYGNPITENSQININRLNPDDLSLDFFSADELLNNGSSLVSYYGFNAKGERLNYRPSIDDFLDSTKRDIAPYNPIYIAGYVEDKFQFRDLTFRLGVRIDRFDANQSILKDPYSLYPIRQAGEVTEINGQLVNHPGNIGDEFAVYVDNALAPTEIIGYRNGTRWYDATGEEILDPTILTDISGGRIQPYLVNEENVDQESSLKLSSSGFQDYQPQVNVMPRVAFSFPISEEAVFYANYDVLTQRPTAGNFATIDDYYFMQARSTAVLANPALKPERRINYELGFKQKITTFSALSLQAFYAEIRDQIQVINVIGAYPRNYTSFGNIDFGTVKGVTASYDIRRRQYSGVNLRIDYTLQFAEGTGSDFASAGSLVNAGQPNLRTIFPLDYDARHTIIGNIDYRFGYGKDYSGPVTGSGNRLLENAGFNLILTARSGTPYSQWAVPLPAVFVGVAQRSTLEGSVNGARLPWQFRADLRVDKDFFFTSKKNQQNAGGGGRGTFLNLYLNVQNLLNSKNVTYVYNYTGQPDDDGYLSSAIGQQEMSRATSAQAFYDQYSAKVNNPSNYIYPRFIRLGAIINF